MTPGRIKLAIDAEGRLARHDISWFAGGWLSHSYRSEWGVDYGAQAGLRMRW